VLVVVTNIVAAGLLVTARPAAAADPTTTSVGSSLNPSKIADLVTFTATVTSGGAPVTTGTVTFSEGNTTLAANVPLDGSGQAAFTTSSLAEGNHVITGTYSGTASFAPSDGSVNQRVDNVIVVSGTTYCNPGAITVTDSTTATPYPSNIFVNGFAGTLVSATVQLKNVTHGVGGDLEVLLLGPGGSLQNIVLLSDAGTAAVSNATVTFDDAAAGPVPQTGSWSSGTFDPTNYAELSADTFPAPAPASSSNTTLASVFNSIDPNGTWSLYVVDDGVPESGTIAGGWCVTFVAKALPTLATSATSAATVNTPISDTATLTGGSSPSGTVTFNLYGPDDATCAGTAVFSSTVAVSGGGATSGSFTPTTAGTYRWTASYSGDVDNSPVTAACNAANETSVVTQAAPTMSTNATPTATVGNPIADVATLADGFNPTGTITFNLYGPNDAACAGTAVFTSTVAVSAGGASSDSFTPTSPGIYRWVAAYSGDTNNEAVTSLCNDANETTEVTKATPGVSTTATTTVTIGSPVSDTALLAAGFNPTGTITFRLYGPNDATCASTAVFTSTKAVSGNASYLSDAFTPTSPGTYRWTAAYSGDANNEAAAGACNAAGETTSVLTAQPLLVTSATQVAAVGAAITDTATLSGGLAPTGTVTFRLFGPDNATCAAPAAFTSIVAVAGNGSYTSAPFTAPAVGTWRWIASYGGDANNGAATGICNGANENTSVVKASPAVAATARLSSSGHIIGDATLTGGFNPTGTMTFRLYGPSSAGCAGDPVFTSTRAVSGNGSYQSDPFSPPGPGTYRLAVAYSGDANHNLAGTSCDAFVGVPAPPSPRTPTGQGYWIAGADGGVFGFGGAGFFGSTGSLRLAQPVVAMANTPGNQGYWLAAADGGVFGFGDAAFLGSMGATPLNQRIVGMAATPTGRGYWLVAADGGIFAFGDAPFLGSMGARPLNHRIVGMTPSPTGQGYWLVAADGGVFGFGDATFLGSMGGSRLAQPVVGMAAARTGLGYWLVAADGGIFAFGEAPFRGSTGATRLAQPIVAVAATRSGAGYWLGAADGGVFAFGDAVFAGSAGSVRLAAPVTAMASA
jgi:subtilisin-like proprotein convertase family protein